VAFAVEYYFSTRSGSEFYFLLLGPEAIGAMRQSISGLYCHLAAGHERPLDFIRIKWAGIEDKPVIGA
jgi:hypothetical protein